MLGYEPRAWVVLAQVFDGHRRSVRESGLTLQPIVQDIPTLGRAALDSKPVDWARVALIYEESYRDFVQACGKRTERNLKDLHLTLARRPTPRVALGNPVFGLDVVAAIQKRDGHLARLVKVGNPVVQPFKVHLGGD